MKRRFIATIQVLVEVEEDAGFAGATDTISEIFTNNLEYNGVIVDWNYFKIGEQFLSPTETSIERFENV